MTAGLFLTEECDDMDDSLANSNPASVTDCDDTVTDSDDTLARSDVTSATTSDEVTAHSSLNETDDADDDLTYSNQAVVMNPDETMDYFGGEATYDQLLTTDVTSGPAEESAAGHTSRGLALAQAHEYTQPIEFHDRAIAVDPAYAAAYANRGFAYA